jgi:hypothetical protein
LDEDVEEDEALLVVVSNRRGMEQSGGAMVGSGGGAPWLRSQRRRKRGGKGGGGAREDEREARVSRGIWRGLKGGDGEQVEAGAVVGRTTASSSRHVRDAWRKTTRQKGGVPLRPEKWAEREMAWARERREMGHRVRKKGERDLGQGERERIAGLGPPEEKARERERGPGEKIRF